MLRSAAILGATLGALAPAAAQEKNVEVMHNMTSPTQQQSVQALIENYKKRGGTWVDSPIAGGSKARAAMANRAVAGDPAEVMYVHAKLVFQELIDAGLTTTVAPEGWESWEGHVPSAIWAEMIDDDGRVVITPLILGVHNVGIFNNKVLERAGAPVPTTWDELLGTLDKVKALGDVIPLAFTETPIQMFQTLHNITAGVGGVELYNRIYVEHDPEAFATPEFRRVAETLRKLKPYTDAGRSSRVWQDAADLVATDKAASFVYGTFAEEALVGAGKVPGQDFACSNLGGIAILGPNGFMYGRPESEAEQEAQDSFAAMVMDPVVQVEFVRVSGGIPSRTDADPSALDACMRAVQPGLLVDGKNVKDPAMTMPSAMSGAVQDAVVEFWADDSQSIDDFVGRLQAAMAIN